MKIFLNDRFVEFLQSHAEKKLPTDLIVEYESLAKLKEAWGDFVRYEKFRRLVIVDPEFSMQPFSNGFEDFLSLFKYIQAAGGLVKNEKGELLFIHRFGFWDLPKGKIDKKDRPDHGSPDRDALSARAAAIREVKEETGLQAVNITKELSSTWHIYAVKEKTILKKTNWFEMEAGSEQVLKPQTSEGIFLVKWTPINAIHCILSHTYPSIRELVLEVVF